jgi:hypothetical protein
VKPSQKSGLDSKSSNEKHGRILRVHPNTTPSPTFENFLKNLKNGVDFIANKRYNAYLYENVWE